MADLITLSEYKAVKGVTTSDFDTQISALIPYASEYAKAYCNRNFELEEYTELKRGVVDNLGRFLFFMKERPVTSVVSVTVQFIGSDSTIEITPSDLTLIAQSGYAFYVKGLINNRTLIREEFQDQFYYTIVYSGGTSNIPGPVKLAVADMVHNVTEYLNRTNTVLPSGIVATGELRAIKIGDYEERYSRQSIFADTIKDTGMVLTQTAMDLLAPYKKMGQSIG